MFITVPSPVTKEITIHFTVIPVYHASQLAVTFACHSITTDATLLANRRCTCEIPFSGIMLFERFVGKYSCWTNLSKVAAERAFQYTILLPAEVDVVMRTKNIQVV